MLSYLKSSRNAPSNIKRRNEMRDEYNIASSIFGLKTISGLSWIISCSSEDKERVIGEGLCAMGIILFKIKIPDTSIVLFPNPWMLGIKSCYDNIYDLRDSIAMTRKMAQEIKAKMVEIESEIFSRYRAEIRKELEDNEEKVQAAQRQEEADRNLLPN